MTAKPRVLSYLIASILCLGGGAVSDAHAEKLTPEAKTKIEAAAKAKAQSKSSKRARAHKGKRDESAYKDCYDSCMSENECSDTHFYIDLLPGVSVDAGNEVCMAAWSLGCSDGCSSLKD